MLQHKGLIGCDPGPAAQRGNNGLMAANGRFFNQLTCENIGLYATAAEKLTKLQLSFVMPYLLQGYRNAGFFLLMS